ncbi:LCP family protein [bacterium]|nr:LCP family protein [bacterium]
MTKRRIIAIVLMLLALLTSGLIITKKSPVERQLERKEGIFLLLLTLEKREEPKSLRNILLISYQPETKRLSLTAIPPKTLISDKKTLKSLYRQKLQRNNFHKGCLSLKSAIEEFLNVEIPFYLVLDEEGFIKVVDLLGGIEVELDQPISYGENFLEKGERLSGDKSLAYLEFEEPRFGEFGKFSRWQRFIWALIQRFGNFSPDPKLVKGFLETSLLTNLKVKDILVLAQEAENIREAGIAVARIPGKTIYKDWMSYWQIDTLATAQLFRKLSREPEAGKGIIRVEVLNGCGRAGIAFQVAQDLRKEGLDVVNISNARNFKYRKTLILNRSGKKGLAKKISEVIGCGQPQDRIEKKPLVDVTIIIGRDYLRKG